MPRGEAALGLQIRVCSLFRCLLKLRLPSVLSVIFVVAGSVVAALYVCQNRRSSSNKATGKNLLSSSCCVEAFPRAVFSVAWVCVVALQRLVLPAHQGYLVFGVFTALRVASYLF